MAKTKWRSDFPKRAEKYAKDGLIDIQIAQKLGISETSFYEYQNERPEFTEAIKRGKAVSDQEVIQSMRKRAVGYEFEETTSEMRVDPEGGAGQVTLIRKTKKHIPPDTGAGAFWLKNRQPKDWRDGRSLDITTGGIVIITDEETKKLIDGTTELGTRSPEG